MHNTRVIIKPLITEKSMKDASHNKFTFAVVKDADKKVIKQVIEKLFDVKVIGITTALVKGKRKRVGTKRIEVDGQLWKKAIVQLENGQKIDAFDIGE